MEHLRSFKQFIVKVIALKTLVRSIKCPDQNRGFASKDQIPVMSFEENSVLQRLLQCTEQTCIHVYLVHWSTKNTIYTQNVNCDPSVMTVSSKQTTGLLTAETDLLIYCRLATSIFSFRTYFTQFTTYSLLTLEPT